MIRYIKGKIESIEKDFIIIDNQGIGYRVFCAHNEKLQLGQECKIFTFQHFREDGTILYGFLSNEELSLFEKLISVKGLGPKTALTILSKTTIDRLVRAIEGNEVAYLKSIPSLGSKTAQQIILDLKGNLVTNHNDNFNNPMVQDALLALKSLGYKAGEINEIEKQLYNFKYDSGDQYLKQALTLIANRKGK